MRALVREGVTLMREPERGLPAFLAVLVLFVFVLPSLGMDGSDGRLYADVATSLVLVSGVAVVSGQRAVFGLTLVFAFLALLVRWATWFFPPGRLGVWPDLITIATIGLFSLLILIQVVRSGPVTAARLQGAVAVYLLLGIAWASAYEVVEYVFPGAFSSAGAQPLSKDDWVYFSFVTLTTVGYGDIVPVHRVARSLAIGEALTGQLYIAVLLARLVSLTVSPRS
jgi:hypothetical protein